MSKIGLYASRLYLKHWVTDKETRHLLPDRVFALAARVKLNIKEPSNCAILSNNDRLRLAIAKLLVNFDSVPTNGPIEITELTGASINKVTRRWREFGDGGKRWVDFRGVQEIITISGFVFHGRADSAFRAMEQFAFDPPYVEKSDEEVFAIRREFISEL